MSRLGLRGRRPRTPASQLLGLGTLVVALLLVPLVAGESTYRLNQFDYVLSLVMVAIGLNVVTGFAGQLSLGPSAVFAFGGYVAAYLVNRFPTVVDLPLMALIGGAAAAAFGLVIGLPALRVGGFYLANVTLFAALVLPIVASNLSLVGANSGISLVSNLDFVQRPTGVALYDTCVLVSGALVFLSWALLHSRLGRHFAAIRTSDELAASLGIPGYRTKMLAFVLSSIPAGIGGAFYVFTQQFISPGSVSVDLSIYLVAACVIGGLGTSSGPLIGGVLVIGLTQFLGSFAQYQGLIFGTVLALFAVGLPQGIMGSGPEVLTSVLHTSLPFLHLPWPGRPQGDRQPGPATSQNTSSLRGPTGLDEGSQRSERPPPTRTVASDRQGEGPVLSVVAVSKRFEGVQALDGVSLEVPAGGVHGLIGSNGSGKTTLLNLISGFYTVDAGSITVNNVALGRSAPWQRARAGIARTFQTPKVVEDATVLDNVVMAADAVTRCNAVSSVLRLPPARRVSRAAYRQAMERLEMMEVAGLADRVVREIPHGSRRLVELARALAAQPSLVLLDEPAAGLSAREIDALEAAVRRMATLGLGVLLVEHNVPLVLRLAQHVTLLHQGRVLLHGTAEEVQADERLTDAFLGRPAQAG